MLLANECIAWSQCDPCQIVLQVDSAFIGACKRASLPGTEEPCL